MAFSAPQYSKNITSIFSVSNQSKYIYFYNIHRKPLIKKTQWSAGTFTARFYLDTYFVPKRCVLDLISDTGCGDKLET